MAKRKYNFNELYRQHFGYVGTPFIPSYKPKTVQRGTPRDKVQIPSFEEAKSYLGTPLIMPCWLSGYQLPNEPLIKITGSKEIVETKFDGNDGTFKELFSLNDYMITISGFAINDEDPESFPEDIIGQLRDICEEKTSVTIVNKFTNVFRIEYLSIKSFDWESYEGSPGMQPYQIVGSSDREFDLVLK